MDDKLIPAFEGSLGITDKKGKVPMVKESELKQFEKDYPVKDLEKAYEASNVMSLFSEKNVRPDELAVLRRKMYDKVNRRLNSGWVDDVLDGKRRVDPSQMKMFALLVDRVIPKTHHSEITVHSKKNLSELSIEELEQIALNQRRSDAIEAAVSEVNKDLDVSDIPSEKLIAQVKKEEELNELYKQGRRAAKKLQGGSKKAK